MAHREVVGWPSGRQGRSVASWVGLQADDLRGIDGVRTPARLLDSSDARRTFRTATPAHGSRSRAHAARRVADDPHAAAVPVGMERPRRRGDRVPRRGEGRERRRPAAAEGDRRRAAHARARRCSPCRSRLLVAYGMLRLSTTFFTELRELVFARVTQRAVRTIALAGVPPPARAVAALPPRRARPAGSPATIERGTRGISTLLRFALFSILPTLLEIAAGRRHPVVGATTSASPRSLSARSSLYIAFTIAHHRVAHALPPRR